MLLLWQLKCYITVVTCAFVICLISMPLALGHQAYVSGKSLVHQVHMLTPDNLTKTHNVKQEDCASIVMRLAQRFVLMDQNI